MGDDIKGLRHSKENLYGLLVMIVGGLLWALLLAFVVLTVLNQGSISSVVIIFVELGALALFIYVAKLFYRAYLFGHAVLISERQFPKLHDSLKRGADRLGLPNVPQSFLYNSNGLMRSRPAWAGAAWCCSRRR